MSVNKVVTALSILLIVTYLLVYRMGLEDQRDKTRFAPSTTLFYFQINDGLDQLQSFHKSPLGKHIASIDFLKTAKKLGAEEKAQQLIQEGTEFYRKLFDEEIIEQLFSKSFGVLVNTPNPKQHYASVEEALKENVAIVADPKYSASLLSIFAKSYVQVEDGFDLVVNQYGNHHINRLLLPQERISYVAIDGLMVISSNERLLRKCIDVYDGDDRAMKDLKEFNIVKKATPDPSAFLYLSVEQLRSYLNTILPKEPDVLIDLLNKQLLPTRGFMSVGYGLWLNQPVITEKLSAHYNSHLVNSIVSRIFEIKPGESSMLTLTTNSPSAYYWSNTFDLYHILPYLLQQESVSEDLKNISDKIREETGRTITEMLAWFDDEISIVVEKGSSEDFFSFPLGAIFLETKAPDKLKATINQLLQSTWLKTKEKTYNELTYNYASIAPQEGLQFVYGFLENKLFIANSEDLIQRIFDNYKSVKGLDTLPVVKEIDPGLRLPNNSVTYSNNAQILGMIKRALSFASTMIAIEDRDLAMKSQILLNDVLLPLFEGLKMYEHSSTRSYFTNELVLIESKTLLNSHSAEN